MYSTADGTAAWRKSSHGGANGKCVEIAALDANVAGVRNSRHPGGPVIRYPKATMHLFLGAVRAGGFALPRTRIEIPRQPRLVSRILGDVAEQLADLTARGFAFTDTRDARGNVVVISGIRLHGNVKDIVQLYGEQDADAIRIPRTEVDLAFPRTVLWRVTGAPSTVLNSLLALADPPLPTDAPRAWATA
ncbi:MAG TPA: DUF397 domain-containing protein [Pseudonocardiaceae bacterium]|nr:DUF397 domain-containing protein [Pseudonocardiaceae bacterium]